MYEFVPWSRFLKSYESKHLYISLKTKTKTKTYAGTLMDSQTDLCMSVLQFECLSECWKNIQNKVRQNKVPTLSTLTQDTHF